MSSRVHLASLPVQDPRRHVPMKELSGARVRLKDIGRWKPIEEWKLRDLTFHAIRDLDDVFEVECDDDVPDFGTLPQEPGFLSLFAEATLPQAA